MGAYEITMPSYHMNFATEGKMNPVITFITGCPIYNIWIEE